MKIPLRIFDWKALKKTGKGYTYRELSAVQLLKELHDAQGINNLLNIGFHDYQEIRKRWWIDLCRANSIDWYILEIFKPNCDRFIEKTPPKDHHRIINGDAKDIQRLFTNKFDVIMHWHGPEHISKDQYLEILPQIEASAKKMIILGSPNGPEEQGIAYGNPYEEHISFWSESDYQKLGYKTIVINDKKPGHITAYKKIT